MKWDVFSKDLYVDKDLDNVMNITEGCLIRILSKKLMRKCLVLLIN